MRVIDKCLVSPQDNGSSVRAAAFPIKSHPHAVCSPAGSEDAGRSMLSSQEANFNARVRLS